jgi:hypothetical protein
MGSDLTPSAEFYAEVGRVFANGEPWGENLEALNILLHGGIRRIPKEFRLVWKYAPAITSLSFANARTARLP